MNLFRRVLVFAFEHTALAGASLAVIVALLLVAAWHIRLEEDVLDMLPQSDPYVQAYTVLLTHFQQEEAVIFDVTSAGPQADLPAMENAAEELASKLRASGLFQDVIYRTDPEELQDLLSFITVHQPELFGPREAAEYEKRIQSENVRKTLAERKRILYELPAPSAIQNFSEDPLFFSGIYLDRLTGFWSRTANIKIHHGYMLSRDQKHLLMIAQPAATHMGDEKAEVFVTKLTGILRSTPEAASGKVRIAYLAAHRFQNDNATMIKRDIRKTLTLSFVAIAAIVLVAFRRPLSSAVLTLLPAFFGGTLATATLALLYPSVSAIAIGCGAMLAGIVVDFGIHFLYLVDSAEGTEAPQHSVLEIAMKLFTPMSVAAGNTVVAFLLLLLSILPGYHQLGVFAAVSIAGAFLFSMLFLPLIASRRSPKQKRPLLELNRAYPPLFRWIRNHLNFMRIAGFVWVALCLVGISRVRLEGDVQKLNGITEETRSDWQSIVRSFGDINDVSRAIVEGKDVDAALAENEKLLPLLDDLMAQKIVSSYQSVSTVFPSLPRQQENVARWRAFWNPERIDKLKSDLQSACDELRMNCSQFDRFLAFLTAAPRWIQFSDFEGPILKGVVASRIAVEKNRTFIVNDFRLNRDEDYPLVVHRIKSILPEAHLFDGDAFVKHVEELTLRELIRLGSFTIAVVVIIFWLYARNFGEVLRLLAPLIVTLICTFGIMGWLQIPFNVLNCIILIFVFGLVDDYCVFLHSAFRESSNLSDEHLVATSGAITLSAASTLVGIGSLSLAQHPSLHSIGVTSLLAIATGIIAVLFSLPWIGKIQRMDATT